MTIRELFNRSLFRLRGRVVHRKPKGAVKGLVLFSYITLPYLRQGPWDSHTNYWEGREMVEAFVERGYSVDVIDSTNHIFRPKKDYDFFIDNAENMQRLSTRLPRAKKIFHITNAEPRFQNKAAQARADALEARRSVRIAPDRIIPEVRTIELADCATALGNKFTIDTYMSAGKPITRIPLSTTHQFPFPQEKNFEGVRKNFVWIGGAGLLHKGLDLVLEAFATMPEYSLAVIGKVQPNDPLAQVYAKELYETPNIKTFGYMSPGDTRFRKLCDESLGIVSVSCSEGGGGSVILGMHAGLIPIVNYESSVDVDGFGIMLGSSTVTEIKKAVQELSAESRDELLRRATSAWTYARAVHTRERFAANYRAFVDSLIKNNPK